MASEVKSAERKFPFGAWVRYSATYYRGRCAGIWTHDKMDGPERVGVVVGVRWKCAGHMDRDYEYGDIWETKGKKHLVLLVRSGYANRTVEVPLGCATVIEQQHLPTFRTANSDEANRQIQRDDIRMHPDHYRRDEKGRFTSNDIYE